MWIVKIGGGATIDHDAIATDLGRVEEPMIIVHGANADRDKVATSMGVTPRRITSLSGYESVLSDDALLDLQMMVYAGLSNKRWVSRLRRAGVNAIGLSGLDGGLIVGKRNPGIRTRQNGKKVILRDHSGKPIDLNIDLLKLLLREGYTPVVCVPIGDEQGRPLNSENDDIVALFQRSLEADRVIQLIEAPGLLADPNDPNSLIPRLSHDDLETWEARVEGRMRRKLRALTKLIDDPRIYIGDGRIANPIINLITNGRGTLIQ